jgi:hypothetical protein
MDGKIGREMIMGRSSTARNYTLSVVHLEPFGAEIFAKISKGGQGEFLGASSALVFGQFSCCQVCPKRSEFFGSRIVAQHHKQSSVPVPQGMNWKLIRISCSWFTGQYCQGRDSAFSSVSCRVDDDNTPE